MRDITITEMISSIEEALEGRTPSLAELGDDYAVETAGVSLNPTNQC